MAFHPDITRKDDVTVALDAANAAVRIASRQLTGNAGTVEIPNADGTSTIMGAGAGDTGIAPWVGDTTAPGKPTGLSVSSKNAAVIVNWDGSMEGGKPVDWGHLQLLATDDMGNDYDFGVLYGAGSQQLADLTPGAKLTVWAVGYDDAHDADGNSTPNASTPSDNLTVTVESVVDPKDLEKAQDDAQAALDQSGQAVDMANAAQAAAQGAQTTADGKNKIFSSATQPSATGLVPGDLWFQLDSSSHVKGIQVWNGSGFVDYLIVANEILVAGSVGTTQIKNGAITTDLLTSNAVTAIKIAANTITGDKLDVGSVAAAIVRSNQFVTDDGLKGFDSDNGYWIKDADGNYLFHANTDGNIEMQDAVMKGGDVAIGDPSLGQIHLGVKSNNAGTIEFINDNSYIGGLDSYRDNGNIVLALYSGALNSLIFVRNEPTNKYWAVFEGCIYATRVDNLPIGLQFSGRKGTIGFVGGVRYVYDGNGSWQEYDTRVVSTNLTDFFTPASGFTQYNNESQVYRSGGLWHLHVAVSGTITKGTYTMIGTVKEEYRPITTARSIAALGGGYTGGSWLDGTDDRIKGDNAPGRIHVGNKSAENSPWAALDFIYPDTQFNQ